MFRAGLMAIVAGGAILAACGGGLSQADRTATVDARGAAAFDTRRAEGTATNTPNPPTWTPTTVPTATPTPSLKQVNGTLILEDTVLSYEAGAFKGAKGQDCNGTGGYSDIVAGAEVDLSLNGRLIDVGHLSGGIYTAVEPRADGSIYTECVFFFVLHVPYSADYFNVKLGHRGEFNYKYDEITSPLGLAYTLGSKPQ